MSTTAPDDDDVYDDDGDDDDLHVAQKTTEKIAQDLYKVLYTVLNLETHGISTILLATCTCQRHNYMHLHI